jgi:membrane associated rhomboid family serine protease
MREPAFQTRRSATVMLIIANVVAFLVEWGLWGYHPQFTAQNYGAYFALSWAGLSRGYVWQLFTFQFMHAGFLHLFFNCFVIYMFGRELEQVLGTKKFLTLYLASGAIGGLVQALAGGLAAHFPESAWAAHFTGPAVGASAGALGLVAAYATLYPERPLMLLLFFIIPVSMRAKFLLLFSALLALFGVIFPVSNVADAAHLGGIIVGVLYIRYAVHWEWHWPRLRRGGNQPPRRLVRVSSGSSAAWGRNRGYSDDEIPADEFLSKEVDPILDKISAHGIQSLTERERRILQSARDRIKRR